MKNTTIFGIACAAVALFLGYELVEERKASKRKEETYKVDLDKVTEEVSSEVERGVHDKVIHDAIEKYAERKVAEFLNKGTNQAVRDAKSHIYAEINSHVNSEWEATKNTVANRMLTLAERCDINELKNDAVEAARDKMLDELSDKLEELADKVNEKYEKKAEKIADSYEEKFKNRMQYRYGMFF